VFTVFLVRPAVAIDIPHLIRIDHSSQSDYVWQLDLRRETGQVNAGFREVRLPRSVEVSYPRDPATLTGEWNRRDLILIALQEEKAAGYACAREDRPSAAAWITDLVVAPEWRRKGAASALLTATQAWAVERGARRLVLEMQSKNHACIRFAQKSGFEFCGYNDLYYATRDVMLLFAKTIK
jgi:GNAT superfamily N-acetyltransferase